MALVETYNEIVIDSLTQSSVSILTKTFIDLEGIKTQVGNNKRMTYANSVLGRDLLLNEIGSPYYDAIMVIWGDEPILIDPPAFQEEDELLY